jgi:hypothetical protein
VGNAVGVPFRAPCRDQKGRAGTEVPSVLTVADYLRTAVDTKAAGREKGCLRSVPGARTRVMVTLGRTALEIRTSDPDGRNPRTVSSAPIAPSFTRGYLHLVHVQDGGNGANAAARGWDNVGFDGPWLPPLRSVAVPDALKSRGGGVVNLGWATGVRKPASVVAAGVNLAEVRSAVLAVSVDCGQQATGCPRLQYAVNGHRHTFDVPPALQLSGVRGLVVPLVLAELRTGSNKLAFYGEATAVANVNLYLSTG